MSCVGVLLEGRPHYAILFAVCSKVMHVLSCSFYTHIAITLRIKYKYRTGKTLPVIITLPKLLLVLCKVLIETMEYFKIVDQCRFPRSILVAQDGGFCVF